MHRSDDTSDWIGRTRTETDVLTPRMVAQYRVTLTGTAARTEVPPGIHWCLAPDLAPPSDLGRDGHPRPGLVLPDLPLLPRRMWAGGALDFAAPFRTGDSVTRRSTVTDITFKQGRSGKLGFVTLDHEYEVERRTVLRERQDIVYREDPAPGAPAPAPEPAGDWHDAAARWRILPTPTLLFRYSALTFNGHRIHYDHPYATGTEGYGGLVVHGPLQSAWMQNLAREVLGALPRRFEYRGLSPLLCGEAVAIEARRTNDALALRVRRDSDGAVTMQARADPPGAAGPA